MSLGFLFNGRNQPELGEKYFRRALRGLDAEKDPVAVFNAYLSLARLYRRAPDGHRVQNHGTR